MLWGRPLDAGVPSQSVTADETHGIGSKFPGFLDQRRISYMVAVARRQSITLPVGSARAGTLAAQAPPQA